MNREQAIAYGKTVGVKFYVMNTNGGLVVQGREPEGIRHRGLEEDREE